MVTLTKRNHSNPCFWTAFWNVDYYFAKTTGGMPCLLKAREQVVYSLNAKADKIIQPKVKEVHVENDLGSAQITPEAMKDFCKRHFPTKYETFAKDMENHPETLIMDLEQILSSLENTPAYQSLIRVITKETIDHRDEIAHLSSFIVFQHFRSHAVLRAALECCKTAKIERFEYYLLLKQAMGNSDFLFSHSNPLATSHWIVYRTENHCFPLPDTPVLMAPQNIMIALSPRMLLEIDCTIYRPEGSWEIKDGISKGKADEYRCRAIANTYKEVIFHDSVALEKWRNTEDFKQRVELLRQKAGHPPYFL